MTQQDEFLALQKIDEIISIITDQDCRDRIIHWIISKYASENIKNAQETKESIIKSGHKKPKNKIESRTRHGKKGIKVTLSIDKSLNTRPKGKASLQEIVATKKPETDREKVVVCVYYLIKILDLTSVNQNHVYTCYKHINWRLPYNLPNVLRWVASQRGWLDTSNLQDIKITTHGENLVEHDLPKKEKVKK